MKKIVKIKGMSCEHCQNRVEKALNALPGISADVKLKEGAGHCGCGKATGMKRRSREASHRRLAMK
jgi:copper chaperone CopZ